MTENSEQSCRLSPPNARLFCVCHMSRDNSSRAVTLFYYHANTGWHVADTDCTDLASIVSSQRRVSAGYGVVLIVLECLFVSCEVTKVATYIVSIIVSFFEVTHLSPPACRTSSGSPRWRWRCRCPPPTGWWWWGCELSLWHSCENDLWAWAGFHFSSSCQWRWGGRARLRMTQSPAPWF